MDTVTDYETEIAPARTFVFVREIQQLRQAGLIKGGNLDNAIVIYERQLPQDELDEIADALNVPRQDASELGNLNHRELAFPMNPLDISYSILLEIWHWSGNQSREGLSHSTRT